LFLITFIAFAYFHQGGGWNQNARFALVRAIVEEGRFAIDSYLVYLKNASTRFLRVRLNQGEFELDGKTYALAWPNGTGKLVPASGSVSPNTDLVSVEQIGVTGDVAFANGHFHPAKAPGTSLLALPAYFVLYRTELLLGIDPDQWWTLTLNAWLTSVFTVALVSALGGILFFRLSMRLSDGDMMPSILSTLTFAFGTMFFPYATMFYEHDLIVVALLASLYLIDQAAAIAESGNSTELESLPQRARLLLTLSGSCVGFAAIANYVQAMMVVILGVYLVSLIPRRPAWLWYAAGVLGPFLVLCFYNASCFGTLFTTNYQNQNQRFLTTSGALLGVFVRPQLDLLPALLFSPFRGLFFSSPVLLAALPGLFWLFRNPKWRKESILCGSVIAVMLAFNISFNGWHGGWASGPRYLIPMLPFLALPIALAWQRLPKLTGVLALLSTAVNLLVTTVDPQPGVGVSPALSARSGEHFSWRVSPVLEYEFPLFFTGRASPVVNQLTQTHLNRSDSEWTSQGLPLELRQSRRSSAHQQLEVGIQRGDPKPFLAASLTGPVSVNPIGAYESWFYAFFPAHSPQSKWNSFNLGEFLFPESRLSLLPLILMLGLSLVGLLRMARNECRGNLNSA
jgi:hypothetical protein